MNGVEHIVLAERTGYCWDHEQFQTYTQSGPRAPSGVITHDFFSHDYTGLLREAGFSVEKASIGGGAEGLAGRNYVTVEARLP
jgi:hypothetical protein